MISKEFIAEIHVGHIVSVFDPSFILIVYQYFIQPDLKEKKPDFFTLQFCIQSKNKNPRKAGLIVQNPIRMI